MLEIRHLTKIYSAKGGAQTKALDDVSVSFQKTGLVFLLGKSGSGKSTLLNLAGGLDSPTSGEIIVMGKSSKDFSGADFDSYRNTFVGFIFQEYNVLDEFTVEDNIALALELQGKPKDKEKIRSILRDVELENFAKRKPNTLSGGQKQRIAIARALVKDPQIIMADEPTGALDSATGKQVFDTLKALSKTRLVLVVSHDREFAEIYGDRIIELKDGKIISDVTKTLVEAESVSEKVKRIGQDTLSVQGGKIDSETLKQIEAFLSENEGEVLISKGKDDIASFRRANRISDEGAREKFKPTSGVKVEEYDGKKTKFIKSRLPLGRAVKMGASGLKTKPVRLIFTILLAVVAFVMFGVLSTFMLYDPNYSVSQALQEADYPSLTVKKSYTFNDQEIKVNLDGTEEIVSTSDWDNPMVTQFGVQELKDKNAAGHGNFAGIVALQYISNYGGFSPNISMQLVVKNFSESVSPQGDYYVMDKISGFTDCGEQYMQNNGFDMVGNGHYPKDKTEVALPKYLAELFVKTEKLGLDSVEKLIGQKIRFSNCDPLRDQEFTVSAIYNVGEIPAKYDPLKENGSNLSNQDRNQLMQSLSDLLSASFHTVVYVSEDFCDTYKYSENYYNDRIYIRNDDRNGISLGIDPYIISDDYTVDETRGESFLTEKTVNLYKKFFSFYGLDNTSKQFSIADGQIFVSEYEYYNLLASSYTSKVWEQLRDENASYFDEAYRELYENGTTDKIISNMSWDGKEAFEQGKEFIETWYPVILEKQYNYRIADYIDQILNNDETGRSKFPNFHERLQAITDLMSSDKAGDGQEEKKPIPDSMWQHLKTELDKVRADKDYAILFDCFDAQEMYNSLNFDYEKQSILDEEARNGAESGGMWTLLDEIRSQFYDYNEPKDVSSQETLLKQILDDHFEEIMGYERGSADAFEFRPAPIDWKYYYKNYRGDAGELEIVGYFTIGNEAEGGAHYLVSSSFLDAYTVLLYERDEPDDYYTYNKQKTDYVAPEDARYDFIITLTDNTQEEIAVALNSNNETVNYKLTNSVYQELDMFLEMITEMQLIFLIVGLVVGVFAALMLLNFISTSITAKKKEIGILRAVGARGSDTFKIFFSESLIIALICFVLASVASFFVCGMLNNSLADIVSMQLLNFNIINILLILVISLVVSFIATFFPVWFAAKKKPVESIRAL